jgi:hypothetical protein
MAGDPIESEYPVIKKMYELTIEYTHRVKNFPRESRFILGDRILVNCYDVLEGLVEARYAKDKAGILRQQNLRIEKLRFQTRLSKDLHLISNVRGAVRTLNGSKTRGAASW